MKQYLTCVSVRQMKEQHNETKQLVKRRKKEIRNIDGLFKLFVNCWCWTQNLIPSLKIFRRHSRQCFTSLEKNSNFLSRIYRSQARIKFWGQKFELCKHWSRQLSQSGFGLSHSKRSLKSAADCHTFLPSQSISFLFSTYLSPVHTKIEIYWI